MRALRTFVKNASRTSSKNAPGKRPYRMLEASPVRAIRKSGPGQQKRLDSVMITQERMSSSPSRRLASCGISIASAVSCGGVRWRMRDRKHRDHIITVVTLHRHDNGTRSVLAAFFFTFNRVPVPQIGIANHLCWRRFWKSQARYSRTSSSKA
jgi:hypothetical protein